MPTRLGLNNMEVEQKGIKWWKHCTCCQWTGKARKLDNDRKVCPNCGNYSLDTAIDKRVFNGKRYDDDILSDKDRDVEDEKRQNEGRRPALPDVVDNSAPGYEYEPGSKPNHKPKNTEPLT